jgi:hypothetical protein
VLPTVTGAALTGTQLGAEGPKLKVEFSVNPAAAAGQDRMTSFPLAWMLNAGTTVTL